jgi:hypothetical protein
LSEAIGDVTGRVDDECVVAVSSFDVVDVSSFDADAAFEDAGPAVTAEPAVMYNASVHA